MGDGGNESVAVTAGIWGFVVLFALAIACWLLFRSMNKHLRKTQWQEEQDHPVRQRIPTAPSSKPDRPAAPAKDGSPPSDRPGGPGDSGQG